jgi:hypothetical protein
MPDGTSVGGVSSVLFQTLNAKYATTTWEQQIEEAAALWENATNVNLALVSDGGEAVGTSGDQQDDPRFGDIRIGMVPLAPGVLAETFLPPPANGGTDAGDILLNSNVNWQINSNYDLQTVVAHEFGHALGLGESTVSSAVMYGTYNGIKQALTSDDISGIDSIYGTRQFDQFNVGGHRNNSTFTATNINSYITSNAQVAIPSLDITTTGDSEWYYVNVPWNTTGTMTVTVQSSNLSSLSPALTVYSSTLSVVGQTSAPGSLGATISVTSSVSAGQGYYIKVLAAGGAGPIGGYGLLVNFGSASQSPISPPNTVVPSQPNQGGGGSINNVVPADLSSVSSGGGPSSSSAVYASIGSLNGWVEDMTIASTTAPTLSGTGSSIPSGGSTTGAGGTTGSALATSSGRGGASGSVIARSSSLAAPAPSNPIISIGPAPLVLQAVDDAINQWGSHKKS